MFIESFHRKAKYKRNKPGPVVTVTLLARTLHRILVGEERVVVVRVKHHPAGDLIKVHHVLGHLVIVEMLVPDVKFFWQVTIISIIILSEPLLASIFLFRQFLVL